MERPLILPVREFRGLTPRTRLLTLEAAGVVFAFHAGQAVWLRALSRAGRKPYSIASAPADLAAHGVLDFLVGLEEDGRPGEHLGEVAPGALVEIEGPLGGFDLPRSVPGAPVLLVAGGTGIAPLRSMWREQVARHDGSPLAVVYSARWPPDLAFLPELRDLEARGLLRLAVTITGTDEQWAGTRGRLTEASIAGLLLAPADTRCAICGPASFVTHVETLLRQLGVPPVHIARERW
jgi:NAD(P)H-flavin reductase